MENRLRISSDRRPDRVGCRRRCSLHDTPGKHGTAFRRTIRWGSVDEGVVGGAARSNGDDAVQPHITERALSASDLADPRPDEAESQLRLRWRSPSNRWDENTPTR